MVRARSELYLASIAYLFSVLIRLIWLWSGSDLSQLYWNDQLMINSADGYTWGAAAQQALVGGHETNFGIRGLWDHGIIAITVALTALTPMSLESVMLYLPVFISSLVVFPLIHLTSLYNRPIWGFLASILGTVFTGYYNRTRLGYYDTDMFAVVIGVSLLYWFVKCLRNTDHSDLLKVSSLLALSAFFYNGSIALSTALCAMYLGYVTYLFKNKPFTYHSYIIILWALSPLPIVAPYSELFKILSLIALYFAFKPTETPSDSKDTAVESESKEQDHKYLILLTLVALLGFLTFGETSTIILNKLKGYSGLSSTEINGIQYQSVIKTIVETNAVSFDTIVRRTAGVMPVFIVAIIGYFSLLRQYRELLISLPLAALGLFSMWGGIRFTMYLTPLSALGATYLVIKFTDEIKKPILRYTVALCITFLMAFPSLNALMSKRPSSVLKAAEVSDLHTLGAEVSKAQHKGAYTIAWWDYGYPLWYYAKTNTIIDGARHDQDNLIISKILSSPSQRLAAQLSRVAVETHILQRGKEVAPVLLQNLSPTLFFTSMEGSDAILPNKTREIYLYLPHRMMNILKTVMSFNYLETERTKANKSVIFDNTRIAKQKGRFITLKNGSLLDQQHGEITYKGEKRKLKEFIITENTQSGKTRVRSKSYDSSGEIVVLYMKSFKRFVIMDVETAQSNYIQMYALGRYNPELFELVHSSAYSKIYRLKL